MSPKFYPTDPADRAARVLEIAKHLRSEAERMVALKQFFDSGDTEAAAEALGAFEEGTVATLIRGAAIEAAAMACAKACDAAAPARYTIPTATALLTDVATFEAVTARGDRQALSDFVRLAGEIAAGYSHGRLRDLRNYRLAHSIPGELARLDPAKLLHLWNALDDVLRTIYHLGAGTGIITVSFDAVASVWDNRCRAYWRRLIAGPPGRKVAEGRE